MTGTATGLVRYVHVPTGEPAAELGAREREALDRVNQKVAGRESIEQIIDFLFEETADICPCDRVSLAFVDERGERIVSHYTKASYEPVILAKGYAEDLSRSSLREVIERGTQRIIDDLERYGRERPESASTRLLLAEGVRSSLTSPLAVDGRNVAVLFRSSRRPRAYDDAVVRFQAGIAERLGQAVEKAYRIEQLEAANRAYFELLGFVSHELKSPVASMLSEAQLIAQGYAGEVTAAQRERLEKLDRRGRYLLDLVKEYLDLARVEAGDLRLSARTVASFVDDVLRPAIDVVSSQAEAGGMRVTLHAEPDVDASSPPVECDPELLTIVVVNLVGNAIKYGRKGGEVRVTCSRPGGALRLAVWNEGPGFAPEDQSRLFKKFSRLADPELRRQKGTGVGLYTCWRIVRLHGGQIRARAEKGAWAEFCLEIPQPLPLALKA